MVYPRRTREPFEGVVSRKSESCFDPVSGEPLREFDRRAEAKRAVKLDPREWRNMEAYRCPKCDRWHLRAVQDSDPIPTDTTCLMCCGRDGRPKVSYPSFDAAREAADAMTGVELTVYECPHGRGWHLTRL